MESTDEILSDFQFNNRWILENYDKLSKDYRNQWIAVLSGNVVDKDVDIRKLVERLKTQHTTVYSEIAVEYMTPPEFPFEVSNYFL